MTTTPETTPNSPARLEPAHAVDLPAGYRWVELSSADQEAILDVDSWAFAMEIPPEVAALLPFPLEEGRILGIAPQDAADDGAPLAAMHASYAFGTFPVPGSTLPTAGLSWVGVHPGHRRRGLARAMVQTHLERTRRRGEVLSALFAAEPAIYGRFGYGCAAQHVVLTVPRGADFRVIPAAGGLHVTFERVDASHHAAVVAAVHDAVRRPGWAPRNTEAHRTRAVTDVPAWRDGFEALRLVTVRDAGGVLRGYALFQRKEHWTERNVPAGTVKVVESATLDAVAAHALWRSLTDLDLMASVRTGPLPLDDPLLLHLVDLRKAAPAVLDNIWLRIVDLPRALAGRAYAADIDVVLDVADALLPANAGRWRLRGGPTGAQVTPADGPADLALDVRDLASAYLGGTSLAALAGAGLVTERRDGALAAAATAFSWPVAPMCNWVF